MPSADDVRAARAAGLVTEAQAEQLIAFFADRPAAGVVVTPAVAADPVPVDAEEETPRFVRSFQDVFLTIGIVLLLIGVGVLGNTFLRPAGGVLVGAAVSYFLAIGFARRRRLVLPSMALAVGFVVFTGFGVATLVGGGSDAWNAFRDAQGLAAYAPFIGALASVVAAGAFYLSFRLPFALGLLALGAVAIVFTCLALAGGEAFATYSAPTLLVCGLVTFAAAMAFDLSDPLRRTLRADNAFWLHLAAAPMIVHAVIYLLVGGDRLHFSPIDAVTVVVLVALLALVAIVIDRRALFVSALSYFGFAVAVLLRQANIADVGGIATTLVVTGACVIALGVGWHAIRRVLLGALPKRGLILHLPPVR